MHPSASLSGRRRLALIVLGWLFAGGLGLAQSSETLRRLDDLLEHLETPSSRELLKILGPAPDLDELLRPLDADFVPYNRRDSGADVSRQFSDLTAEIERLAQDDIEGAVKVAAELASLLAEELGEDHPNYAAAARRLIELEAIAELTEEDRVLLRAARAGSDKAISAYRQGKIDEGIASLVARIDDELLLLGDEASLTTSLTGLGVFLHAAGDYPRAERAARAGLARALQEFGPVHPYVANGLNSLAWLSSLTDNPRETEAWHAHSLALRRTLYGDSGPEVALALMHLVDFFHLQDDFERALMVCERAIEILSEADIQPDRLGILLSQRGFLEWSAGDDLRARESLAQAVDVLARAHAGDHAELVKALGLQADVERTLGEYARALEMAETAAAMLERLFAGAHPLKGQAHYRLAICLEAVNELGRAEEEYRRAVAEMESTGMAAPGDLAKALNGLAALLARRGDATGAEALSARVPEQLRRAHGNSRLVANAYRQLARRRRATGDSSAAAEAQGEALKLFVELLGEGHARVLQTRIELARLLAEDGDLDAARELVSQVLDAAQVDSPSHHEALGSASLLAGWLARSRGEIDQAADFVQRARAVKSANLTAPHPELIEVLFLQGQVLEMQGDVEGAAAAYAQALQQCDALRVRILGDERDRAIYARELSLGGLSRSLARVRLELGESFSSLEAAEMGRERALLDLVERSSIDLVAAAQALGDDKSRALQQSLQLEASAQAALLEAELRLRREAELPETGADRVAALEADLREARRELLVRQGELEAWLRAVWPTARPLAPQAIVSALEENEALLHYTFDDDGVHLIALLGESEASSQGVCIASGRERVNELRELLLEVGSDLRSGNAIDPAQRLALSQALLPDTLWEHLAGRERLVIVPDGPLHELPFEVLATPSGDWLEHGPRLVYSPSATLFARMRQDGVRHTSRRAVVLGAPHFESGNAPASLRAPRSDLERLRLFGGRLAPLPGSAVEAREVSQELTAAGWQVDLLLGKEAHAKRLFERARGAGLVHLSTHGLAPNASSPYDAALALAAPQTLTEDDDGFLTLDDLVRRWGGALTGCDLVVLSACDTQAGVPLGESRVALSWGFFFAGAESVLVSLWKVDDRATALLMQRFYENFTGRFDEPRPVGHRNFEPGSAMPEDAALQEAKAWLARSTPEENRARLLALGFDDESVATRGDFPRPGAAPTSRAITNSHDFRAPRFGSAFALYGQPD